jgi:hypothetical protein
MLTCIHLALVEPIESIELNLGKDRKPHFQLVLYSYLENENETEPFCYAINYELNFR